MTPRIKNMTAGLRPNRYVFGVLGERAEVLLMSLENPKTTWTGASPRAMRASKTDDDRPLFTARRPRKGVARALPIYYEASKEKNFLRSNFAACVAAVLFALSVVCVGGVRSGAGPEDGSARLHDYQSDTSRSFRQDEVFDSFEQAFRAPAKVRRLVIQKEDPGMRHLPPRLSALVNLEVFEISCLENLEDLPEEIGELRNLEELIIDNGNGCSMNVSLPRSIGRLGKLRVLRLYGALDPRDADSGRPARRARSRRLPDTIANLTRLEELDLGRNGLRSLPPQVASLRRLKRLGLDYNDLREIPPFVGNLTNLEELSLRSNGGARLPQSLAGRKGLRVFMGNNSLTLRDQRRLRSRFPDIAFSFDNEFDDDAANEDAADPRPRRRPRRRR